MELNSTPSGERINIAIFGKRNVGKSSVINAITGQNLAIVSDVKGTTTDPVYKAMEILPLGAVMLIDTPGLDDEGELGKKRIEKTEEVLRKTDIAIIVIDIAEGITKLEEEIIEKIKIKEINFIIAINKIDKEMIKDSISNEENQLDNNENIRRNVIKRTKGQAVCISARDRIGIEELKNTLAEFVPNKETEKYIVKDLLEPLDTVVLVIPIDESAPKGRLILPQQQIIRELIENNMITVIAKENNLKETLDKLIKKPKLVITDSQVFEEVAQIVEEDIWLTSFSILFARYKGDLEEQIKGVEAIKNLKDGDIILMAEGCSHHRQCNDIGTVKIPKFLLNYTKCNLIFEQSSGREYKEDLSKYALIVHCGGCMLNAKEMKYRIDRAKFYNKPIVNYGILIAYLKGILKRSVIWREV